MGEQGESKVVEQQKLPKTNEEIVINLLEQINKSLVFIIELLGNMDRANASPKANEAERKQSGELRSWDSTKIAWKDILKGTKGPYQIAESQPNNPEFVKMLELVGQTHFLRHKEADGKVKLYWVMQDEKSVARR